jgi:hypothetical protein
LAAENADLRKQLAAETGRSFDAAVQDIAVAVARLLRADEGMHRWIGRYAAEELAGTRALRHTVRECVLLVECERRRVRDVTTAAAWLWQCHERDVRVYLGADGRLKANMHLPADLKRALEIGGEPMRWEVGEILRRAAEQRPERNGRATA